MEVFFGHTKDQLNIYHKISYEDLKNEIDDFMDYYNNYRYQWKLNKMTPIEYKHLIIKNQTYTNAYV